MTGAALNPDELLHLAILDSRNGRHDEAILKLKRCIADAPTMAQAYHLLAAEHAEIGMSKEAIAGLEKALALDPRSVAARFQLGLLRMLTGDPQGARREWDPLSELDPAGPWNEFKGAFEALLDQNTPAALAHLDHGLGMEFNNAALRADMTKLRERIARSTSSSPEKSESQQRAAELLRKTYQGPDSSEG